MVLMMNDLNGKQDNNEQIVTVVGCLSTMSDDGNCPSSPRSSYGKGSDLMAAAMEDKVTAQLAAAGPVGVAPAAAIVSSKKPKMPHSFETNPAIRKRQQNRLLRILQKTVNEFATKIGEQAIVLVATPGKPNTNFKVLGAKPLEDVIRNLGGMIMEELGNILAQQVPPSIQEDPKFFELPPLIFDGIPTPVEKLTQAQLRAFIPHMMKFSTGRRKPGWGRESSRPPWWPKELPWANIRMDARSTNDKWKISWTRALRQIVINCYKYHGRENLLSAFSKDHKKANAAATANSNISTQHAPTVLHTIINPDGTVSVAQIDPNNPVITLLDVTTAHVQEMATLQSGEANGIQVSTIQNISEGETAEEVVDLNSVTELLSIPKNKLFFSIET